MTLAIIATSLIIASCFACYYTLLHFIRTIEDFNKDANDVD